MKSLVKLCCIFPFVLLLYAPIARSQSQQEIDNLIAFSKAYGYVKYFHPSTEGDQLDWGWFSVYGAQQIRECEDDEALIQKLNSLFSPFAPTVHFAKTKVEIDSIRKEKSYLTKENGYRPVYWQHYGVSKDMINPSKLYKSVRANSVQEVDSAASFGGISYVVNAKPYLEKKVRLSGMAKLATNSLGTGRLWLRVDNEDRSTGFFENMGNNPITLDSWESYEITGVVNTHAKSIVLGGFLEGKGQLLLDEMKLEIEEDGKWIKIPVIDESFEVPDLSTTDWGTMGKGYAINLTSLDKFEGSQSLEIKFVGAKSTLSMPPIFKQAPSINEPWVKEIKNNIWMYVPMVLFEKNQQTFPQGDLAIYDNEEESKAPVDAASLDFRLGNLINTWNVFQHFFPYFKEIDVNWEAELQESLRNTYNSDESSHIKDLQELTAKLKDGHIQVTGPETSFTIPSISWDWVEGKLILTAVFDDSLSLKTGDVVEKVEGVSPEKYFSEIKKGISAATEGWMNHRAASESLFGPKGSVLELTVNGEIHQLTRNVDYYQHFREAKLAKDKYKFLDNNIAYINLDNISVDTLQKIFPNLEKSSAIIADLRGYPNSNHQLIAHLLKTKEDAKWMHVDQFIYPDQVDVVGHSELGWSMKPEKPYLRDKKIIFLTDGQAISYAESYMGYIEAYDLGLVVGQPTAGTNGNINMFVLPGEYRITFTGMRVTKHDNTQFHGIGILPDVYVEKTIEGVSAGRDEFLEKAIEIAAQQ